MNQQGWKKLQLKLSKSNSRMLKSQLEKIKGYMFSFFPKKALIFELKDSESIHMFFVFFRMKAVWLSADKKVIQLDDCTPFSLRTWSCPTAKYLVEFPSRWNLDVKMGDTLEFLI